MPPRPRLLVIALPILLAAATAAADDRLEDRGHYRPSYFAEFLDVEIAGDRAHGYRALAADTQAVLVLEYP